MLQIGENVGYQEVSVKNQWGTLRQGIIHVQIEVWQPSMALKFNAMVSKHFIIDAGSPPY